MEAKISACQPPTLAEYKTALIYAKYFKPCRQVTKKRSAHTRFVAIQAEAEHTFFVIVFLPSSQPGAPSGAEIMVMVVPTCVSLY